MTFTDIMALAKMGYKPSDIKELLALNPDNKVDIPAVENTPTEEAPEVPAEETVQPEEQKVEETSQEPNYKELYEKTQEDLKKLQLENVKRDNSKNINKVSDEDTLLDIVRNI